MDRQGLLFVAVLGVILTQSAMVLGQTVGDPSYTTSLQADVRNTVLDLLNSTGYSGAITDSNVQAIVDMLINGTGPTEQDLLNLGFYIPTTQAPPTDPNAGAGTGGGTVPDPNAGTGGVVPPPVNPNLPVDPNTGLPPGTFPNQPPPTDPNAGTGLFPNQPPPAVNPPTIPTTNPGTFPNQPPTPTNNNLNNIPFPGGGFIPPPNDPNAGTPPGTGGTGGSTGGTPGTGLPGLPGTSLPGFPNLFPPTGGPGPNPMDILNPNSVGGSTNPLGGTGGINPFNPNAIGTKPFPNNNMGTPGSTTGILDSQFPTTGILDAPKPKPKNNFFSNPLFLMMMMPEMMEGMMGGENPMMTYFLMKNLMPQKKKQPPAVTLPNSQASNLMNMANSGGFPGAGTGGGFPALPPLNMGGPGAGGIDPMGTGLPPMGGAPGGGAPSLNDLMSQLGAGPGAPTDPMAAFGAFTGTGGGGSPTDPYAMAGAPPPTGGANDLNALMNMINTGTGGAPPPGGMPTGMDPFMTG